MTYAPETLLDARAYIIDEFGVAAAAVGIVGDANHDGGYHCGDDRVDADDYSVRESSRDRNGLTDAASALDLGRFTKGDKNLSHFSRWLAAECARGAADTRDIREVIYSPDGRRVERWDRLGRRSSGDDSHLWHTHISYFRDSQHRDKTALFRRYIEGDDMDLSDRVKLSSWILDNWDELDDSISVRTALGSGYGHARSAKDGIHKTVIPLLETLAAHASGASLDDVRATLRTELAAAADRERAERAAELAALGEALTEQAPVMAAAIAEALPGDIDVTALADALGTELASRLAT